ncbi:MAG: O-antigen ligase family protein [Proteobacteria bacterium]|nr:O-antigen ligase family protein [Pseudomonadota bacterium]
MKNHNIEKRDNSQPEPDKTLKTGTPLSKLISSSSATKIQSGFLHLLFLFLPFSIAGQDFAIIGFYLVSFYLLLTKNIIWEKTVIQSGFLILIFGFIISSLLSEAPLLSFSYTRKFWKFLLPFFIYFSLKEREILPYLKTLGVSASLIAIYAIIQHFTGLDLLRSDILQNRYTPYSGGRWLAVGLFSHHLTFGGVYLLICSPGSSLIFCKQIPPTKRVVLLLFSFTSLLAVIFSFGRSNWLGIFLSFGIISFFQLGRKRAFYLSIGLVIILTGLFYSDLTLDSKFLKSSSLGRRVLSLSLASNKDRLLMWRAGVEIIKDNPIFGLGPNMGDKMLPYYDKVSATEKHKFQHHPKIGLHNIYLQTWIDFGLAGLAGYLLIWLSLLIAICRKLILEGFSHSVGNTLLLGLLGGFSGSMLAGFFENNFRDGEVQATILTFMGLALILLRRSDQQTKNL